MSGDTPTVPPDVVEASQRLQEHSPVHVAPMPQVFVEIIKNHNRQKEILAHSLTMTQAEWRELKELRRDFKKNLRPSAELALKWNTDKGDTPRAN